MKKTIAMILTITVVAAALTACNMTNNSGSGASSSAPASTADETVSSGNSTESSDVISDEKSAAAEDTSNSNESNDQNPDDNFAEPVDANSKLEFPDTKAGELMKKALSTDDWGYMSLTAEQDIVDTLISNDLKFEDLDDYCIAYTDNSAQLFTAIIVKPKEGKTENVSGALKDYLNKVKTDENLAFYPMQQESADGAVYDELSDGYLALIVNANGQAIMDSLRA